MKCAHCGKEIRETWVHKKPLAYATYTMTSGLTVLCRLKCELAWVESLK